MDKYHFNEHQLRLWNHMVRLVDAYIKEEIEFHSLVGSLEGALDAGEFKNNELTRQWRKFWGSLENYNAVMLDKGEKPKKEYIIEKVEAMRKFLLEQLELDKNRGVR